VSPDRHVKKTALKTHNEMPGKALSEIAKRRIFVTKEDAHAREATAVYLDSQKAHELGEVDKPLSL
jgi:hypothetical protein